MQLRKIYLGMSVAQYGLLCYTVIRLKSSVIEHYNETIRETDVNKEEHNKLIKEINYKNKNDMIRKIFMSLIWPITLPINIWFLSIIDKHRAEIYECFMEDDVIGIDIRINISNE